MNTTTEPNESIMLEADPTKEMVAESFNISDARRDELCDIIEDQFDRKDTNIVEDMVAISAKCENHEELAFSMMVLGAWIADKKRSSNPFQAMMSALSSDN